ncbi:MAG: hypothetical protein RI519_07210, partial [Balneolaceae bacterium]|nr:hypothetical protein [Balneolaceae bacterium]
MNRILRFYKHLPSFGWNPIILTVGNGLFPSIDHELSKTVRKQTIVYKTNGEYSSAGKPTMAPYGFTDKKNKSLYKKIIQILKVNIIPDNRIYWLPFAMRKSKEMFH